jgi:hypothetical protein
MAATNGDAKKAFDLLSDAAEQFRNLDAHGGSGKKEQSLLVHSSMGAIPEASDGRSGGVLWSPYRTGAPVVPNRP